MIYLGVGLISLSLLLFLLTYRRKIDNQALDAQLAQKRKALNDSYDELDSLHKAIKSSEKQILFLTQRKNDLKTQIDKQVEDKRANLNKLYNDLQKTSSLAFSSYEKTLDEAYNKKENEITTQINEILNQKNIVEKQKDQAQKELDQVKHAVQAATAARLIQQEKEDKWRFYGIHLTDYQIDDIAYLQEWKHKLYDPSIVSKIIWSAYYIKPVGDMCNRVLGTQKKCGIYKLTNKATGQVYIGQSVDVSNRWKTHIKYGLGIDTPITPNKLYQSMQNSSLWYWTFELLQECPKEKLNERERFWIDFYQSDKTGLNGTKGNK